ncbi:MAG: transporter substrate-binding domain-containing protein [Spirochaetota bacterium]
MTSKLGTKRIFFLFAAVGAVAGAVLLLPIVRSSPSPSGTDTPVFVPLTAPDDREDGATAATITARGDWAYPPFEFLDESGRPDGFNIDILTRIAEIMNLDIRINLGPWEEVRHELENGDIEILAGMYRTPERDRRVDFSVPHFIASYGVFVPKDSDIRSVEDIRDRRILVQTADLGHDYLVERGIGAEIVTVSEWDALIPALEDGAAECLVMGMVQGMRLLQEEGYRNVRVLSEPLLQRPYSIAVREGDAELLAAINEGLNLLKISGEYNEIHDRWFGVYDEFHPFARPIIHGLAGGILILALGVILMLLWSYSLRRRVREQTAWLADAMRELEQANSTKDRFLASVSHELRTPLHGIMGMAQLMEKTDLDERQTKLLEMMNTASEQLNRILSDLLDTSRMNAGQLSLRDTPFSLDWLAHWLEPVLRRRAEDNGLRLQFVTTGDTEVLLRSDRERIAQIIINLADNAIKNTDSGTVEVSIGYPPQPGRGHGVLDIEVRDTGRGIAEEEQERIFDPFAQGGSTAGGLSSGLGLGLSIVKSITELLGGSIALSSTPGEGSTFSVRLPVAEYCGDTRPCEEQDETEAARGSKEVLVAEDEAINRLYLQQLLESRGWTVGSVGDGEQAVREATARRFDLILLDVSMPRLDGLEATTRLRRTEAETGRRRTPIIALTAHADEGTKRRCTETGMDGFISKPFGARAMWEEIERVLSSHTGSDLGQHTAGERHPSE